MKRLLRTSWLVIGAAILLPSCSLPSVIESPVESPDARLPLEPSSRLMQATYLQEEGDDPAPPTIDALPRPVNAGAITLVELEDQALANNPTLVQAQANVEARFGTQIQVGRPPNPRLAYQHNEIGNEGTGGLLGAYWAREFVRGGKLILSQHAASHATQSAEFRLAAQQYRVLTAVRTDFYDVLAAQQTIVLAEELVKISQQGIETTEALIRGGQASRVDLLQARVQLNNARIAVQQARNRHQAAWRRLAADIGLPSLELTQVSGSLETEAPELDAEETFQQVLTSSPELAAAEQEMLRAQAVLQRAMVEPIPNVDVMAGVQYDYTTSHTVANVQVEMPWPVRNRNQGNIMKARAELVGAEREMERVEFDLRRRFAATLERYANASVQVERYKNSIVPDAQESLKLLSDVYRAEGRIDFVRLLIAQQTNFQTQIDYLNALRDWWLAKLEIDGLLLTGGLQRPRDE